MRRRLLPICASLSLLACLAVLGIWYYTTVVAFMLPIVDSSELGLVFDERGFYYLTDIAARPEGYTHRLLGFTLDVGKDTVEVVFPYWAMLGATLVAPALWLWAWAGRRRQRALAARGCCAACGYDLRASSGRCPECGQSIPAPVK